MREMLKEQGLQAEIASEQESLEEILQSKEALKKQMFDKEDMLYKKKQELDEIRADTCPFTNEHIESRKRAMYYERVRELS